MDQEQVAVLYERHSRQVLATLIRLLGDFSLAEEAMQEAFVAALRQWPEEGVPDSPVAWLVRTGQRRGIDQIRRRQTANQYSPMLEATEPTSTELDESSFGDDQLRLLFTCCHPGLAMDARLALTLREMCGLTTEQVAHALLQKPATLAQRIVRAKRKIRDAAIPYEVPETRELPGRLPDVLRVIYLLFNEGYSRSGGESVTDVSLAGEAIRLGHSLAALLPHGEVFGLLALMLLHDARKAARENEAGELVALEDQDRGRWDRTQIDQGLRWLEEALALTPVEPYTLQASIAAEHARAATPQATDWGRIVRLYEVLYRALPSPVVALNHAAAVAMRDGPAEGLRLLDALGRDRELRGYHLFHAARADLHRRAGETGAAVRACREALALVEQGPERRFLERRLRQLESC